MTTLLAEHVDSAEPSDYVSSIQQSGNHLLQLLNNVLDFRYAEFGKVVVLHHLCAHNLFCLSSYGDHRDSKQERVTVTLNPAELSLQQTIEEAIDLAYSPTADGCVDVRARQRVFVACVVIDSHRADAFTAGLFD